MNPASGPAPVSFPPAPPLRGRIRPPADKSISHRAAIVGAMASEEAVITNFLDVPETRATLAAVQSVGGIVTRAEDGVRIRGCGLRGALAPPGPIDARDAGTLMRLLPGWLAGQAGVTFTLDGDARVRRQPVDRIVAPLRQLGAQVSLQDDRYLPLQITGAPLTGITYELPIASAPVKSCVLLAGTLTRETCVVEDVPTRDHTERALLAAGARMRREVDGAGRWRTSVGSTDELELGRVEIPGDISSAAYLIAAGVLVPGSRLIVDGVGVNWTRTGFLRILERMGGIVVGELEAPATVGADEPSSDIDVAHGPLTGVVVGSGDVAAAIDELPLVALLGCFADGETVVTGAEELRVKETDRIDAVVDGLRGLGADIEASADGFRVRGGTGLRGGRFDSRGDHRMAMLGAVAGLVSRDGVEVVGFEAADGSYPGFRAAVDQLAGGG